MAVVLAWREKQWKLLAPGAVAGRWFVLMTRAMMPRAQAPSHHPTFFRSA